MRNGVIVLAVLTIYEMFLVSSAYSQAGSGPTSVNPTTAEAQLLQRVPPAYPPLAQQARVQGPVVLDVVIGTDGSVTEVRVISGHPMLVQSAVDAVKQWKYKPYMLNGAPVEVRTRVTIQFSVQTMANSTTQIDAGQPTPSAPVQGTKAEREGFAKKLAAETSTLVGHSVRVATGGAQAEGIVIQDMYIREVRVGEGIFAKDVGLQFAELGFQKVFLTNGAQWWCNSPDERSDTGWWKFGVGGPFKSGDEAASNLNGLMALVAAPAPATAAVREGSSSSKPQTCFNPQIPLEDRSKFMKNYQSVNQNIYHAQLNDDPYYGTLQVIGLGPKDKSGYNTCPSQEHEVSGWLASIVRRISDDYQQMCKVGIERVEVYAVRGETCLPQRDYALYLAWVTPTGLVHFLSTSQENDRLLAEAAKAREAREKKIAIQKPVREAQFKQFHLGESQEEVKRTLRANGFRTTQTVQDLGDGGVSNRVVGKGDVWTCDGGWAKPPYAYIFAVECLANSKDGIPLRLMFAMKERVKDPDTQEIRELKLNRLLEIDYNEGEFHVEAPLK